MQLHLTDLMLATTHPYNCKMLVPTTTTIHKLSSSIYMIIQTHLYHIQDFIKPTPPPTTHTTSCNLIETFVKV